MNSMIADIFFVPIAIIYFLVVGCLFIYGINFFYLAFVSYKNYQKRSQWFPKSKGEKLKSYPKVTVQLPIYNEMYVAERLIFAAAQLEYPADRLEIQVLDDSTDETYEIAHQSVTALQLDRVNIQHIHRTQRTGFKAGALADGLASSTGEYIAIFDADFVPNKDFLLRTIPAFSDTQIAFVQTRWGHLNRNDSILTKLQSLSIDGHFIVEQNARYHSGFWFNFNGTAGVWRKQAIIDAGGWKAETLTEDLDLSYRAFLKGWKACYLNDVEVPAELPVSFGAYRRQQHRWARGSLECSLKFLPKVWAAPISIPQKIEATLHLTGYYVHILLFILAILYPAILYLTQEYTDLINLFGIARVFNFTALAPAVFFIIAQRILGRHWLLRMPYILFMTVLGAGMMLNTLRAGLQIYLGKQIEFERTPKFGWLTQHQGWQRARYSTRFDPLILFELAFAAFNFGTVIYAWFLGNWVITLYAGIFTLGLLFTAGFSLRQQISLSLENRK